MADSEVVPVAACETLDSDPEVEVDSAVADVADTNTFVQYFSLTSHIFYPVFNHFHSDAKITTKTLFLLSLLKKISQFLAVCYFSILLYHDTISNWTKIVVEFVRGRASLLLKNNFNVPSIPLTLFDYSDMSTNRIY